jgi:dCMP deaminase
MIINAGIKKIYYAEGYDDPMSDQMFEEAGLQVVRLPQ